MATHVLEMFSSSTSYDLPLRSQVAHGRPLWEACDLSDALGNQATVSSALKSVNTWDLCFTPEFVPQGHGGARTLAHHLQPEHPPFLVTLHQVTRGDVLLFSICRDFPNLSPLPNRWSPLFSLGLLKPPPQGNKSWAPALIKGRAAREGTGLL